MTETQIFRISPTVDDGKYYEYAECTRKDGVWPNKNYYTNNNLIYVGKLIKTLTGGYGDNRWRRDYFSDNYGKEHIVNYSYEGNTCFREVSELPIPSLEELSRNIIKKHINYSHIKTDNPLRILIEEN